jgi:hypothetical protein
LIDWSILATKGVQRFQQTGACEELMVSKVKKYLEDLPRK